jgi:hypothetical protein
MRWLSGRFSRRYNQRNLAQESKLTADAVSKSCRRFAAQTLEDTREANPEVDSPPAA